MYALCGSEQLQQKKHAFDNHRALGGKSGKICRDKSCDVKLRGGTSANHVKHLRRARRPSAATHSREIPATDEPQSQNT